MIDSKVGERVVVSIHSKYGPYIRVSTYDDAGALEDLLDEKYFVLYWKSTPPELLDDGGNEYYFGNAADPVKLQFILDSIIF
ncbi:hypothetical protein B7R56_27165 [Pseudomonas savastanoi pv. retacarpa]|uniref:Uncharacterized protein n=2 Tax=Pseudomonas syringae group TaxID=136849 RepID=A0A3M5GHV3_PSESS|nr:MULTISPECIES: hypothetical protein [Pseudomonas]PPS23356.1 hypothetical protein BVY11_30285 [Pseudomonas amygdali pv. morsprunorum]KPW97422.1 hypothetical protein ALO79_100326 [Pseudomonas syringae pv. castaneae]KPX96955.1 hypothetical protein ALO61_101498 [Pseudomonas savastanoi pv. nerii]KPY42095.1 Uncharacterized protein ALO49_02892 [Pseudomonas savastanoi pv. retacarpa]MBA4704808.1 hypothetical protein [Pseudomonas savastanoi pv. savastanoi]